MKFLYWKDYQQTPTVRMGIQKITPTDSNLPGTNIKFHVNEILYPCPHFSLSKSNYYTPWVKCRVILYQAELWWYIWQNIDLNFKKYFLHVHLILRFIHRVEFFHSCVLIGLIMSLFYSEVRLTDLHSCHYCFSTRILHPFNRFVTCRNFFGPNKN